MIKVFLLSTISPSGQDTHWASPYHALKLAFEKGRFDCCEQTSSPDAADLIIICPRLENPVFPKEIFRDGIAHRYRKKCIVLSTDDNPSITHKGFYTALSASTNKSNLLRGGVYPLVAQGEPCEAFPLDIEFHYLFSFLGSFDTHPVRRELGLLDSVSGHSGVGRRARADFLIRNTSQLQAELVNTENAQIEFKERYLDSLKVSKFILCPRGRCPSSVRVFEAMKARRVPVIISDDWVPPPEIPWRDFAFFIKERDARLIPEILKSEESSFVERAISARGAWDNYLSAEVLPETITRWGMSLLEESHLSHNYTHSWQLLRQLFTWRFIRRGVISELRRILIRYI